MANGLAVNDTVSHAARNAPRQSFAISNSAIIFNRPQLRDQLFVSSLITQLKLKRLESCKTFGWPQLSQLHRSGQNVPPVLPRTITSRIPGRQVADRECPAGNSTRHCMVPEAARLFLERC
jgi:hypothetical protein